MRHSTSTVDVTPLSLTKDEESRYACGCVDIKLHKSRIDGKKQHSLLSGSPASYLLRLYSTTNSG